MHRPSLGQPALYPNDAHIVAVASDVARPAGLAPSTAWLDLNAPDAVLAWVRAHIMQVAPVAKVAQVAPVDRAAPVGTAE